MGYVANGNGDPADMTDSELSILWRSVALHTDAILAETYQQLMQVTAERDALRAQLDAVPVHEIIEMYETNYCDMSIMDAWIRTVKP